MLLTIITFPRCIDFNDVIPRYFNDVNATVNELLNNLEKMEKIAYIFFVLSFNYVFFLIMSLTENVAPNINKESIDLLPLE